VPLRSLQSLDTVNYLLSVRLLPVCGYVTLNVEDCEEAPPREVRVTVGGVEPLESTSLADDAEMAPSLTLATWGLFVGLGLLLVGSGLFGTLLGVRAELAGVPTIVSSAIAAAYYTGFLAGSRFTLDALSSVGHIRVYAALASTLAAAVIAIGLTDAAIAWVLSRFISGLCIAGQYVVAESWLNDLADNDNRGRLLAIYMVVTTGSFGVGQLLLFAIDPKVITGYAIASIVTSLAVVPVALSEKAEPPAMGATEHLTLGELARIVPTGVFSCLLVGVTHGALTGMAVLYATRVGLSAGETGVFLAAPLLGGMVMQFPISAASDDLDRRAVGLAISIGGALVGGLLLLGPADHPMAFVLMALLGGLSYPLYSIAGAYTNDWVDPEHVNAAASQLVTMYGFGAAVGPFVAAGLMVVAGPSGFIYATIILHLALATFFGYRMRAWRAPLIDRPWRDVSLPARAFFVPATLAAVGRRRLRAVRAARAGE
jgi:MFS family permease